MKILVLLAPVVLAVLVGCGSASNNGACAKDPTCDDGIACTVDVCETTTGICAHLPDNSRCPSGRCEQKNGCSCSSDSNCASTEFCIESFCKAKGDCSGRCCWQDGLGGTCPDTCGQTAQYCHPDTCKCGDLGVKLQISEDSTHPCLGASHLRVIVHSTSQNPSFDDFGQFFSDTDYSCTNIIVLSPPNFPTGNGIILEVQLWDSTIDSSGLISTVNSAPFNLSVGSPVPTVGIQLSRFSNIQLGSIIGRNTPDDWSSVQGVGQVRFTVTKNGDTNPTRTGLLDFDAVTHPNPFPLTVTDLQSPTAATQYNVAVEDLSGDGSVLHTWHGVAWLTPQQVVADVSLGD